jgi:hypothetical protein
MSHQVGESVVGLWGEFRFLAELACTDFPLSARPAKPNGNRSNHKDDAADWQEIVEKLADRVACATSGREVRICLNLPGQEYQATVPSEIAGIEIEPPTVDVWRPTRLAAAIRASSQWLGYIDVRNPEVGFTTEHRALVRATVASLGLAADRAALRVAQNGLSHSLVRDCTIDSMLDRVWAITERQPQGLRETLESVILALRGGVPYSAAILALWNVKGGKLYESKCASSPATLSSLEEIVNREANDVFASGTVWARRLAPEVCLSNEQKTTDECRTPSCWVIMVPLRRLRSARGVLALGRDGSGPGFSTEEKHALCVVSGLVTEQTQI